MIAKFQRAIDIACPVSDVFRAWSDPEIFVRWFAPMTERPPEVAIDFRVGGRYSIRMGLAGGNAHLTQGEYREIIRNRRIAFTWHCDAFPDDPSLVTVTFEETGPGTRVTVEHEQFQTPVAAEAQSSGWTACLDSLKTYLETEESA